MSGDPFADNRRLVTVFAVTMSTGFIAMSQALPVALIPISESLDASRAAVTAATSISTLVGAAVAFPVGRLLDRHGGRWIMTVGSAIGVLSIVLWSQATSLTHLYLAFAAMGLGTAMCTYEAAFAVLVVASDPSRRDRSILTVTMIAGLSTYLVYPPLGWLVSELGWRHTLLVLAGLMLVTSVPGHLWSIPDRATHVRRVRARASVSVRVALRQRRFWLLAIAFVGQAAATSAVLLLVFSYLLDVGHSLAVASTIPMAVGLLQILSRLALTTFARRLPLATAAAGAFAIQGIGLLALPLVGLSIPLTFLCVSAVGLANGVSVIARPSILADTFGAAQFASIMAAIVVPMALARAGAPLVAAWLADWRFLVAGGVVSLGASAALLPLVPRRRRGGSADAVTGDAVLAR
jgi:predicted MFS family arabinose efflux permease